MHKADAKRIDWFLSLQQLFKFQKNFIAPSMAFPSYRSPADNASNVTISGRVSLSDGSATSRPSSASAPPAFTLPNRVRSLTDGPGRVAGLRVAPKNTPEQSGRPSQWRAPRNQIPVTSVIQITPRYAGLSTVARRPSSGLDRTHQSSTDPVYDSARSEKPSRLAPTHFLATERNSQETELNRPPAPTAAAGTTFLGRSFLPSTEQSSLTLFHGVPNQSLSPDPDETPGDSQPQHNGSPVAMLHIDGSALGRWVIQHLERALGKPATGMTGVDPRVTVPRSRVAPF
jgi:hypothetical protein